MVEDSSSVEVLDTAAGVWCDTKSVVTSPRTGRYSADAVAGGDAVVELTRRCRHAAAAIGDLIFIYGGLRGGVLLDNLLVAEDLAAAEMTSAASHAVAAAVASNAQVGWRPPGRYGFVEERTRQPNSETDADGTVVLGDPVALPANGDMYTDLSTENGMLPGSRECWYMAYKTIEDAGGWKARTVVEDMDLAVWASLKTWKYVFVGVSVFGVSAESMQCSYDSRGNNVPTILLLMQERLYAQGGLKAEGIFRINAENNKEEEVREQLNRGTVPEDIDVHCLVGLIKAWFIELPCGVLDGLSPKEVLQCNTEDDCAELVKHLKPTETALLNWAVDLMSDVVEHEESNKMNARNIAMVFAPNMTQMSDSLTAQMHAVQVMNLLKTLITKTLREREEADGGYSPMSYRSEEIETSSQLRRQASSEDDIEEEDEDEVESLREMEESLIAVSIV